MTSYGKKTTCQILKKNIFSQTQVYVSHETNQEMAKIGQVRKLKLCQKYLKWCNPHIQEKKGFEEVSIPSSSFLDYARHHSLPTLTKIQVQYHHNPFPCTKGAKRCLD